MCTASRVLGHCAFVAALFVLCPSGATMACACVILGSRVGPILGRMSFVSFRSRAVLAHTQQLPVVVSRRCLVRGIGDKYFKFHSI